MKIDRKILLVAFLIAFVIGLLNGIIPYFAIHFKMTGWMSDAEISGYQYYMNVTRYWLGPTALFITSYIFGKNTDIKAELKTTIIYDYLSCLIGSYIGHVVGFSYMFNIMQGGDSLYPLLWSAINSIGSATILFFISFSGIIIANVISNKAEPQNISDIKSVQKSSI